VSDSDGSRMDAGRQFQLPTCVYKLFKCSFVNHKSLSKFV